MAKDELKGQTLLCPKCHQPLTIGEELQQRGAAQAGGMDDLFDEVGLKEFKARVVRNCGAASKPNAVMCVECGFNLQTNEQSPGGKVRKAGERGHGEAAEELLSLRGGSHQGRQTRRKKEPLAGSARVGLLPGAWLVGASPSSMFMIPKDQAFRITGMCVAGHRVAWQRSTSRFASLIVAFQESVVCGISLPGGAVLFAVLHHHAVGRVRRVLPDVAGRRAR